MRSLPLFHRISGQPVIVLGEGEAAEAKRRLVERAGGVVAADPEEGIRRNARLAFVAHDESVRVEADVARLREAGVLVNAPDRPDLCDFTVPSLLDRDPVLIAIGTSGASAGLAKAIRLRLETLLPQRLGALANALHSARSALRARWSDAGERRRALDAALAEGGALDPLREQSADAVPEWLENAPPGTEAGLIEIELTSDDPEDLTLRQARLLGSADAILYTAGVAPAILARARADAVRHCVSNDPPQASGREGLVILLRRQ
ncbi:MAG: siroheme synthase [Novosphingobium sp.]